MEEILVRLQKCSLTLKALSRFVADDIPKPIVIFLENTTFDISCESSAKQMIHMKFQVLFSLKNKKNISKCRLL